MKWIKCNNCGNETSADLDDCVCERCGELDWSEPEDDGDPNSTYSDDDDEDG